MRHTHTIILFIGLFVSVLTGLTLVIKEQLADGRKFQAGDNGYRLTWAPEMQFAMMLVFQTYTKRHQPAVS
jgi:hypothetical protein